MERDAKTFEMSPGFKEKVYNAAKQISKGRVATYKVIAHAIGKPKAARAVGNVLNKNYLKEVPCHRIICSDGRVGGFNGGTELKIKKIKEEGVVVKEGKVDLKRFGCKLK